MSGFRQYQHPWLSDHVIYFCYRWISWLLAVGVAFAQHTLTSPDMDAALLLTGVLNVLSTAFAQPYVRAARRNPAILTIDMLLVIPLLLQAGGWLGPFGVYATSSLVLPGLLFGWRGGLMAGLLFVTLNLAGYWAANQPPEQLWQEAALTVLLPTMLVPPLFGMLFPVLIDQVRRLAFIRTQARSGRRSSGRAQLGRDMPPGAVERFSVVGRGADQSRKGFVEDGSLAAPTTAVRAAEQSVEDLRRAIFTPFPSPDMELPAALDLLAVRFGQHTGAATRVTLLGRARLLHRAQRGVLVRLTQEALLNVQQHAHAATIQLTLRYDASSVALLIQDDGVGLLDGTYERPGLHALRAMQYRLSELGGRLDVFETEGGGVTVRATIPLEH